jgi:DNA-directed RNA polymerase subunit RPC12/RpoP
MSELYHSNCGGVIKAVSTIELEIITFGIFDGKLMPGAVQASGAFLKKGKTPEVPVTWACTKCSKKFTKEDIEREFEVGCRFCGDKHPISDSVYTQLTPFSGKKCLEKFIAEKKDYFPMEMRNPISVLPLILDAKISG